MASTEDRVAKLAETHLGISDRSMIDASISELGVSSMNAVSFLKKVNEEFVTNISVEEIADIASLRDLINHLESKS